MSDADTPVADEGGGQTLALAAQQARGAALRFDPKAPQRLVRVGLAMAAGLSLRVDGSHSAEDVDESGSAHPAGLAKVHQPVGEETSVHTRSRLTYTDRPWIVIVVTLSFARHGDQIAIPPRPIS